MRNDPSRLAELQRLAVLDSSPERAFDDITRLLSTALAVPITMVNLLDTDRDWFMSRVGIQQSQSPAASSICEVFFNSGSDLIVVENTLLDERFRNHGLVTGPPNIRFYAAARLVVNGQTVGTLCAYDMQARQLSVQQLEQLRAMAAAVVELLHRRGLSSP